MKKMIAITIVFLTMMLAFEQGSAIACVDYPDWMSTSVNLHAVQLPQTPPPIIEYDPIDAGC
jgi:hypothetical protein